jgi:hypothetical protein
MMQFNIISAIHLSSYHVFIWSNVRLLEVEETHQAYQLVVGSAQVQSTFTPELNSSELTSLLLGHHTRLSEEAAPAQISCAKVMLQRSSMVNRTTAVQ